MTLAFGQAAENGLSFVGTAFALTAGSNFGSGQALVGMAGYQRTDTTGSISDITSISDGTNTYTNANVVDYSYDSVANYSAFSFFLPIIASGANTITITLASGGSYDFPSMQFQTITGASTGCIVDQHTFAQQNNIASSPTSSGNITPAIHNDYIYYGCLATNFEPSTLSAVNGTQRNHDLTNGLCDASSVQTSPAAVTAEFNVTTGANFDYLTVIIAIAPPLQGSVSNTFADFTDAATGAALAKGTVNNTFADFSLAAVAQALAQGILTNTFMGFTLAGLGEALAQGTTNNTFLDFVLSGSGSNGGSSVQANIGLTPLSPKFSRYTSPVSTGTSQMAGVPDADGTKANNQIGDLVTAGIGPSAPIGNGVAPGNQTAGVAPVQQVAFTIISRQAGG